MRRDIKGRRGRGLDATKGSEAEQHGVDVPRVRQGQGQGALGAVVVEGEAQKPRRDWARLDLVEMRQSRDKKVEVVKTKAIGRVRWKKRQEVRLSIKLTEDRRETRRRLDSLPASFRP